MPHRLFGAVSLLLVIFGLAATPGYAQSSLTDSQAAQTRLRLLRERAHHLQPVQAKQSQRDILAKRAAPSRLDVLVVGCDFADSLMWGRDLADFPGWPTQRRAGHIIPGTDRFQFAAHDSVYFDIQMKKVADYFETVSFGALDIEWDVHGEIINVPEGMGYYGDADSSSVRLAAMSQFVIDAVDDSVDFSAYDTLLLIHAGAGKETDILGNSPNQIFSNYLDLRDFADAEEAGLLTGPRLLADEGPVEHVLILPESESQDPLTAAGLDGFFGTRGVYCFEFGLRLGMLSLADFTPSGFADSQGIGQFGLMGYGLFAGVGIIPSAPSPLNRMFAGWVEPVVVRDDASLRIGAMDSVGIAETDTTLIKIPITDREYWLVEFRLQDPDGDLFYTFDRLNPNNVPDYFDADSEIGDGIPTGPFDVATDTWESTLGSEWDFFMSDWNGRTPDGCQRGGGSGLYIWHVDEAVIEFHVANGTSAVNSDRDHRAIDVEEADGLQDLDSSLPVPFLLGWDGDTWRGEGASEFGPDTNPSTDTADGIPTGVRMYDMSSVVVDSLPPQDGFCTGFVYRSVMTFAVEFGSTDTALGAAASRHQYVDNPARHDIRLADLGTSGTDPTLDFTPEIVQVGDGGRVYAFDGSLDEWRDGDSDPATEGVLALATPARPWLGPPAVAGFRGDGQAQIFASTESALFAFDATGAELLDGDADAATNGVMWTPPAGTRLVGAPILTMPGPVVAKGPAFDYRLLQLMEADGTVALLRMTWNGGSLTQNVFTLAPGVVSGPACVLVGPSTQPLAIPWRNENSGGFLFVDPETGDWGGALTRGGHGGQPPLAIRLGTGGESSLAWVDSSSVAHLAVVDTPLGADPNPSAFAELGERSSFAATGFASAIVGGPIRPPGNSAPGNPILARSVGASLELLDRALSAQVGSPYRPLFFGEQVLGDSRPASPVLVDIDGDGPVEVIWHDPVGRLHAVDFKSRELSGWPAQGPGEPVGSPAVGDVDGDGNMELVVGGVFDAIVEIDGPNQQVVTRASGELRVYDLPPSAAPAVWPQGRGGAGNEGRQFAVSSSVSVAGGTAVDDLFLQPNPAVGSQLRVRANVLRATQAVITLYNLEGQEVARRGPITGLAGSFMDEQISIENLVAGHYICRLEADGASLIQAFVVAR